MKKNLRLALIILITVILTLIIVLPLLMCEFPEGSAVKKARELLGHNDVQKGAYVDSVVDTNEPIVDEDAP